MATGKYEYWLTPEGIMQLEAYARDGLTDEQIAHNIGISPKTLYAWKKRFPELDKSLRKGKEVIDIQVENALLNKALGAIRTIKKPLKLREAHYEDGKKISDIEHITYADEEVLIPPDTTAQIFWLKNRRPANWSGQKPCTVKPLTAESKKNPHQAVWEIQQSVIELVAAGQLDPQRANTIISAGNSILSSIRIDEQQKQIEELTELLEELTDKKGK